MNSGEGPDWAAEVTERILNDSLCYEQIDHSTCSKPPVVLKTQVLLWPGLSWPGQAKTELLF